MTTTDAGPSSTEVVAGALRSIDAQLDAIAARVDDPDAATSLTVAFGAVGRDLDELEARLPAPDDDPFDSARMAVAVRRERLGFLRTAAGAPTPAVAEDGDAPPPSTPPRTTTSRAPAVGRAMSILGLLVAGFFLYTLTASSLVHARSQKVLLQEFKEIAPLQAAVVTDEPTSGAADGILGGDELSLGDGSDPSLEEEAEPEVIPAMEAPARGEPIGILQIPSLKVEEVFVQGTGPAELRQGPGHLRGTPMPGEPGNAAIAGARIGSGAPFKRLQELDEGDRIDVTTAVGRFRYRVTSVERVRAGDPDPVRTTSGPATLTLVTSTPKFLAYDRLVAVADLEGDPVRPRFAPVTPDVAETGFDTAPGGLAPVVVWTSILLVALAGARWAYRRWPSPVAYLLTTPILLALLIVVFESLAGILPATF